MLRGINLRLITLGDKINLKILAYWYNRREFFPRLKTLFHVMPAKQNEAKKQFSGFKAKVKRIAR